MDKAAGIGEALMVVVSSIVVIAIIAVIVSGNATTVSVVQAFTQSFTAILQVIVSPITGGGSQAASGQKMSATGVGPDLGFGNLVGNLTSNYGGASQ